MGELARKPGCPKLPETPLELLTPGPNDGYPMFHKMLWPVSGAVVGVISVLVGNYLVKRPIWSGLPLTILFGASGYYGMKMVGDRRLASRAEDDAVLRHYVSLHPEDFPPYERKRWRDVYKPFEPIR